MTRGLNANWPLARLLGVYVSVHWSVLFLPALIIVLLPALPTPGSVLFWTTFWTVAGVLGLWTHEMAHAWAARRMGIGVRHIVLSLRGPLAHVAPDHAAPREQVLVALAGPLVHAAWLLAAWPIHEFVLGAGTAAAHFAVPMSRAFLLTHGALLVLNLLPLHPLDGGRMLRGLLTPRMGIGRAALWTGYLGYGGAVLLGAAGMILLLQEDTSLAPLAILIIAAGVGNLMASQRMVFATQWAVRARGRDARPPLAAVRPPDYLDERVLAPAARPTGSAENAEDEPAARPAALSRPTTAPDPTPTAEELSRRIDALLDRINEVGGLENLSADERRELAEASDRLSRR